MKKKKKKKEKSPENELNEMHTRNFSDVEFKGIFIRMLNSMKSGIKLIKKD